MRSRSKSTSSRSITSRLAGNNHNQRLDRLNKKSQRRESNPRPGAYEASALPTELRWRERDYTKLFEKVTFSGYLLF